MKTTARHVQPIVTLGLNIYNNIVFGLQ